MDETDADLITAMDLGTVMRLSTQIYNESGHTVEESRFYFDVPASGAGADGTNYDPTLFGYDDSGRRIRTKAPHGTITRTVYDDIGRVESRWTGTNDDLEGGTDDIVQVELIEYDGGADGGNGYVTERTLFVQDNSTGQRVTSYTHDARGRVLLQTNPTAPHALHKYDNEGRVVATGLFSSTGSVVVGTDDPTSETANRLALTESYFDEVGQLWKSVRHNIDAADGSDDDTPEHLYWRDAEGRVLKEDGPQLFKVIFDRLGRETHRFILAKDNDSTYAHADDVTGDHVLEEHQTVYDADNDDVLMTVRIDRKHSSWNLFPVPTGLLDSNADGDRLLVTDANLAGRQQIMAMWYDRFGRQTDVVQYGDNGASNFDRDPLSVPSRSDTELVTSYAYETDGTLLTVTDPRGLVKKTVYDEGGRLVTEKLGDETDVDLRFIHEHERDDGGLIETVTLDEFTGDPPTVSTFVDDLHHESTLYLLAAGLAMPVNDRIDLDLSLEAGKERLDVQDVSDDVVVRRFDGTVDEYGGQASLVADTGEASTIELASGYGVHPTETSRIGVLFTFDDTRTSFGSLTWRWHGSEDTTLAATARHEQRRSDAFESEGKADSLSISGSTLVGGTLALDGSLGFRTYDYEADTTFVIAAPAATEIPGHVETEGAQTTLGAGASWEASDALRPRLWTSVAIGTGDASYDYGAIDLDVPYRLTEVWEVGTNVSWVLFDGEEQLDGRDYDAGILVLYARVSF